MNLLWTASNRFFKERKGSFQLDPHKPESQVGQDSMKIIWGYSSIKHHSTVLLLLSVTSSIIFRVFIQLEGVVMDIIQ